MIRHRTRSLARLFLLLAVACSVPLATAPDAGASEITLEDVSLSGPPWRTTNSFTLNWRSSPPISVIGPYTVDYLIRDSSAAVISPLTRFNAGGAELPNLQIPVPPGLSTVPSGRYTIELWAEGSTSPHAFAALGFDDEPPQPVRALAPGGWLRDGSSVPIEIEHPAPPFPLSGIRGYAVVLADGGDQEPCAAARQCTEAETDLDGGIDDDLIQVGPLREGTNIVRVVAVTNSGVSSEPLEETVLHVDWSPPTVSFLGLPDGWAKAPVRVTADATDPLSGMVANGPEGPLISLRVDGASATTALGGRVSTTVHGDGAHRLLATARDAVGNAIEAGGPTAPRTEVRIDETAPRVAFAVTRDPEEPERIVATVSDALSGPAARGTIAVRPSGSSQRFEPLPTAAGAGRLTAVWDSDAYPAGNYEFRASGYDVAGNEASTRLRADGLPMSLSNPVKTPSSIAFGFGGRRLVWHRCEREAGGVRCHRRTIVAFDRRPAARTVPFGHAVPVSGRLTSNAGAPLAGLPVEVSETFVAGSSIQRRTTAVLTRADGTFLTRLDPGPGRQISVAFAGTRQLTRTAARTLQLGVRGRVRLRASDSTAAIGGAPVAFKGKIDHHDAAIPASGLAVELQFQVLGSPWSEFRTIQTDAFGRFSYPYAFSDDDSRGVRFQFRAVVPEQAGWPYESGTSRPVVVTGR